VASVKLHFGSVYYKDILQKPEDRYWRLARAQVPANKLRELVLFGFADAAGLETRKEEPNSAYYKVQSRVADALADACAAVGTEGPVVIFAHSLGAQVISNYLWDAQRSGMGRAVRAGVWRNRGRHSRHNFGPRAGFIRGEHLRALFTVGCNIPVFIAAHAAPKAIWKPNRRFEWHNYFDPDDVLGWPLTKLYRPPVPFVFDHPVNAWGDVGGLLLKSWNFMSHSEYWKTDTVLDDLTGFLRELLD